MTHLAPGMSLALANRSAASAPAPGSSALLLEDGSYLLLEDGSKLLLE